MVKIKTEKISSGFSLIELLVAITILLIVAGIFLANFPKVMRSSRDGMRKDDFKQIRIALEQYKQSNGQYPTGVFCSCPVEPVCLGSDDWSNLQNFLGTYTPLLKGDPLNKSFGDGGYFCYYYDSSSPGKTYVLAGRLENPDDPAVNFCASQACSPYGSSDGSPPGSLCPGRPDFKPPGIPSNFANEGYCYSNYVTTSPP